MNELTYHREGDYLIPDSSVFCILCNTIGFLRVCRN